MGDEDELDRELEQRSQRLAELVLGQARLQVAKPAWRAHAQPAAVVTEQPVAWDKCAQARQPEHRLAGALDPDRLDAVGKVGRAPRRGRADAPNDLVAASPMEANRRVDDDRLFVPLDPRLEWPPELVRDERVDE